MTKIPTKPTDTANLIYESYETQALANSPFRRHLGASLIGDPCRRKLWYTFRGATYTRHPGRVLRLFQRGNDEEMIFVRDLRAIGCTVHTVDPENGDQWRVSACGGHFGGSLDAAIHNLPEAPSAWHVGEFKTHNDKSFKALCKDGVEVSKPLHYAQMQCYMHLTGMARALYLAVNKNDDAIYSERVHHNREKAEKLIAKAQTIIDAKEPLERISERPDWFECKWCDHRAICHEKSVPEVNCRTCAHSTPRADGTWHCELADDQLSFADQMRGCGDHVFIPALIPFAGEMVSYDEDIGVRYRMEDGREFTNAISAAKGKGRYTSRELRHLDPRITSDEGLDAFRTTFDGEVVCS